MNIEERIGYLIAKVEEQGADQRKLTERFDALEKEVTSKLQTAETALRVFKWIGTTVAAAVVLPWERISELWSRLTS